MSSRETSEVAVARRGARRRAAVFMVGDGRWEMCEIYRKSSGWEQLLYLRAGYKGMLFAELNSG
jgi:hypothetical protein